MPKDAGQWGFLVLIIFIIAPLLFWIITLLIAWVKWLKNKEPKKTPTVIKLMPFEKPLAGAEKITFSISHPQQVKLELLSGNFDLLDTLLNKKIEAGNHQLVWNVQKIHTGYYYLRLSTDEQRVTQKIIVQNEKNEH